MLGGIALVAAIGAYATWEYPSIRTVTSGVASPVTVQVSSDPTTLTVALLVVAVALAFMATNGLRIKNVSIKDGAVEALDPSIKRNAKRALKGKNLKPDEAEAETPEPRPPDAPSSTVWIDGAEVALYRAEDVPMRVMQDLLAHPEFKGPTLFRLDFVARKSGQGNNPWLIRFRGDDTTWRVAYGGQGKTKASVRPL